ncbi:MAG: hypothetical protein O6850_00575, partial [Acidobacteria bacterium]|nr:hypothetical protein [Acidobacteriota bacterium]
PEGPPPESPGTLFRDSVIRTCFQAAAGDARKIRAEPPQVATVAAVVRPPAAHILRPIDGL